MADLTIKLRGRDRGMAKLMKLQWEDPQLVSFRILEATGNCNSNGSGAGSGASGPCNANGQGATGGQSHCQASGLAAVGPCVTTGSSPGAA